MWDPAYEEKLKQITYPYGIGGLTDKGKLRGYYIGQFIRERYDKILSKRYFKDEITIFTTDSERTKMTALTALAALYRPVNLENNWNTELLWEPVPYSIVPDNENGYNYGFTGCAFFKRYVDQLNYAPPAILTDQLNVYESLIEECSRQSGVNFTEHPMSLYNLADLFENQVNIGIPIPEWAEKLLEELKVIPDIVFSWYYATDKLKRILSGVFLNDFLLASKKIISGANFGPKMLYFSAHDFTVGAIMAGTNLYFERPTFGSVFALELRQVSSTGQYVVAAMYLSQAGESDPAILPIEGCDGALCDYNIFVELIQKYAVTGEQLNELCKI